MDMIVFPKMAPDPGTWLNLDGTSVEPTWALDVPIGASDGVYLGLGWGLPGNSECLLAAANVAET